MIDALVRNKLPGMPNVATLEAYSGSKKLLQALSSMVITQREGVLITGSGLAKLCGVEPKRLNDYARDRGVNSWSAIAHPLDLIGDLKDLTPIARDDVGGYRNEQPIDYKGDLKESRRGAHSKHGTTYYDLGGAMKAASAVRKLSSARIDGLDDILTRAFGIAIDEIDTNPYRREHRHLQKTIEMAEADCIALLFFDRSNPQIMQAA